MESQNSWHLARSGQDHSTLVLDNLATSAWNLK